MRVDVESAVWSGPVAHRTLPRWLFLVHRQIAHRIEDLEVVAVGAPDGHVDTTSRKLKVNYNYKYCIINT